MSSSENYRSTEQMTIDAAGPVLSAIILTFNEELHIERALKSVASLCHDIHVVDSFSSDMTCSIAHRLGASVVQREFISQADQLSWALENLDLKGSWILRLDADEYLSRELVAELGTLLPILSDDCCGILLKRRHVFQGRWIRFGGRYPLILLRIWRKGKAVVEARLMDEHLILLEGTTFTAKYDFTDENLQGIGHFISKHNSYATREAVQQILHSRSHHDAHRSEMRPSLLGGQAARKRWIKQIIYDKIPGGIAATLYFLHRYCFQLGFVDGQEGFNYHFLQAFWYRYLVALKRNELEDQLKNNAGSGEDIGAELFRITGYRI